MWEVTSEGTLKGEAGTSEVKEPLLTDGKYIKGLSGMTCVLPAWSILEVLDLRFYETCVITSTLHFLRNLPPNQLHQRCKNLLRFLDEETAL